MNTKAGAYITLKSQEPLNQKDITKDRTIGCFSVKDGETVITFDWATRVHTDGVDDKGHYYLYWGLRGFNNKFFESTNPGIEFPGWEAIVKMPIHEVYYEAGEDGNEQRIKMDVVSFWVLEEDEFGDENPHHFSNVLLNEYNKRRKLLVESSIC